MALWPRTLCTGIQCEHYMVDTLNCKHYIMQPVYCEHYMVDSLQYIVYTVNATLWTLYTLCTVKSTRCNQYRIHNVYFTLFSVH